MPKLFSYGCSFTQWAWLSWPHIISKHLKYNLVNRGKRGASNQFIFYRLSEDLKNNRISSDDMVMVMWTESKRMNKIYNFNNSILLGSVEQKDYDLYWQKYIQLVKNAEKLLKNKNRDFVFFSAMANHKKDHYIESIVRKPVTEVLFNNDWNSRSDFALSFSGLKKSITNMILDQLGVSRTKAIQKVTAKDIEFDERFISAKHLRTNLPKKMMIFLQDPHPTPLHNLEYLQSVTDYKFSDALVDFIAKENDFVLKKLWSHDDFMKDYQ